MDGLHIRAVETECRRLLDRIELLKKDAEENQIELDDSTDFNYPISSKHTASVRRASLDLSRALADLRR